MITLDDLDYPFFALLVSVGMLAILWFPVLCCYIFSRRRNLSDARSFSLYRGFFAHGVFAILTSTIAIPGVMLLSAVVPTNCLSHPDNWLCVASDQASDWLGIGVPLLSVIFYIFIPRYFYTRVWGK